MLVRVAWRATVRERDRAGDGLLTLWDELQNASRSSFFKTPARQTAANPYSQRADRTIGCSFSQIPCVDRQHPPRPFCFSSLVCWRCCRAGIASVAWVQQHVPRRILLELGEAPPLPACFPIYFPLPAPFSPSLPSSSSPACRLHSLFLQFLPKI